MAIQMIKRQSVSQQSSRTRYWLTFGGALVVLMVIWWIFEEQRTLPPEPPVEAFAQSPSPKSNLRDVSQPAGEPLPEARPPAPRIVEKLPSEPESTTVAARV